MRRLRILLRCIFYPALLIAVVAVLAACWAVENLGGVVVWFAQRSLPGFSLHLGKAELAGAMRVEFTDLQLRERRQGDHALLTVASAAVDYSLADLWRRHIARVEIERPLLTVDDKSIAAFASPKKNAPAPAHVKPRAAAGAWHVDHFAVRGGEGDIDLRGLPQAHFQFAAEFKDLDLSPEARESRESQSVALRNIRLAGRGPAPKPLGTVSAVNVLFTMDQLAQYRVQALTVSAPSIHFQPAFVEALAAPAVSAPAAQSPAGATPQWRVDRLNVKDGEAFLEGFGPAVPVASAKFAIDATDIGLGGLEGAGGAAEKIHVAQLWDVRAAALADPLHPFLQLASATINFSNAGLSRDEVAKVETTGMWVGVGPSLRTFAGAPGKSAPAPAPQTPQKQARPWLVRDLSIQSGYVSVSDIGLDIPNLGFYIRTDLSDVALSGDERFASDKLQQVELSNLSIHSPLDPFVPVLTLKTIFLQFSVAGLLREEIEDVSILNPQIFVGEDLFWYADALKKKEQPAGPTPAGAQAAAPATATAPASHWVVRNLGADYGEIVIANGGKSRATLPLSFSWRARNVDFNNLDDLQLKLKLVIPKGDYKFPSYQLDLAGLSGKIEFGLPPEDHKDNLVHTLEVKEVRWKDFVARSAFVTVTYDKQGIYGEVGGNAYGGYVTGGFSFFTQPDSPWTGWVSGSKVGLRGVTDALIPESFQLSGPADFKLEVNGLNHEIERVLGGYTMRSPGKLKVAKLDDVMAHLPPDWTVLKSSMTRIGLETLRDFDYESGNGSFWFASDEGDLKLALRGRGGSRTMEAVLHGARDSAPNAPR